MPGALRVPALRDRPLATNASAAQPEGRLHVGPYDAIGRRLAPRAAHPSSLARPALRRQTPEVGAGCSNWARPDLCGGCSAMSIPTAILDPLLPFRISRMNEPEGLESGLRCKSVVASGTEARSRCTQGRPGCQKNLLRVANYPFRSMVSAILCLESRFSEKSHTREGSGESRRPGTDRSGRSRSRRRRDSSGRGRKSPASCADRRSACSGCGC
jgi:hypothetical protein